MTTVAMPGAPVPMPHYKIKLHEIDMPLSKWWISQRVARNMVEVHGCKVCTWKFPGEIFDVGSDLWCEHCVRENWFRSELWDASSFYGVRRIPTP